MSRNQTSVTLAVLVALAVLLVPALNASAQSQIPLFEDELLACVQVGEEVFAAPAALRQELEAVTGQVATVQTLGALIAQLPPANATNGVRFEGGWPAGQADEDLTALGYGLRVIAPHMLPSAGIAVRCTQ